jgi:hypothetical protein
MSPTIHGDVEFFEEGAGFIEVVAVDVGFAVGPIPLVCGEGMVLSAVRIADDKEEFSEVRVIRFR